MKPKIVLPAGIVTGVELDGGDSLGVFLSPAEEPFRRWVETISEGACPGCRGPLAPVCSILTREEWLVCPKGRWLRLVWP